MNTHEIITPSLRSPLSTFKIMINLFISLSLIAVAAVIYYSLEYDILYGGKIICIISNALIFNALTEGTYFFLKDKNNPERIGKKLILSVKKLSHSYGYVSAMIFSLLLPVGTPIYVVILGTVFMTLVGKMFYGGFGKNIFNPAIVGRVFVQVAFPGTLKTFLHGDYIYSGASLTAHAQQYGWMLNDYQSKLNLSFGDIFLGNYRGAIGETFAFLLIIIGIYLLIRGIIDFRQCIPYLLTIFLGYLFLGFGGNLRADAFESAFVSTIIGGALFGGLFCLSDPVTSPTNNFAKVFLAVCGGIITLFIRIVGVSSEGVAYAILLCNIFAPLLDKLNNKKTSAHLLMKRLSIILLLFLSCLSFALTGMYKSSMKTGSRDEMEKSHLLIGEKLYE